MGHGAARLRCLRPYALLLAVCLLLYLPGLVSIPPLDRDEARFVQATRQMLESGDFVHIRFQDEARNRKPAGIYWLQAAAVGAFSTPASAAIWPYRLPSLAGATIAALLTFGFGAALFAGAGSVKQPRRVAAIAAILLASSLGVIAEAHIAKTDAMLLAAVAAGQGALGLAYVGSRTGARPRAWIAVVFWAAEIAAVLLKGPVGPALAAGTAATLAIADRDLRWLRRLYPLAGLVVAAAALAPWLLLIEHATHGKFLADSLGRDFLAKLLGAQESHGAPPFAYLLLAFATFWPGSLLLVPALVRGWRRREAAPERFLLAWLLPAWVLLELVPTKLPHYALPLYPALALLGAAALVEGPALAATAWARRAEWAGAALWGLATLAIAAALIGLDLRFGDHRPILAAIAALLLLGIAAASFRWRTAPFATAGLAAVLSLVFVVAAAIVLPSLDRLWLSRGAAALVAQHPPAAGMPLFAVGYGEPSLVFLLGTKLRLAMPADAATALCGGGEALVSSREETRFLQALGTCGGIAQSLGTVAGVDYSNGQPLVLTLYAVMPG